MWQRLFAVLLCSASGAACAESLLIDTDNSQALFSLRALLIKRVDGEFARVEGVVERDLARRRFSVDVRIDANSVQMERDENVVWAKSTEFFDSERHPWIAFLATDLPERALFEGGEVPGELTVRGVTRPVYFMLSAAQCERPGLDCAVHARGELRRSEFGMDARRLLLGDKVRIEFSIRTHAGGGERPVSR
jgi:polyisoprenoid-binding protein YceI